MQTVDFLVVGAGMAGASVGAALAAEASVLVVEREAQPGYHSTGRSAAVFSETYGPAQVQALSRASRSFFEHPPDGFCDHPILTDRGLIMLAREGQSDSLDRFLDENRGTARRLSADEVLRIVPIVRPDGLLGGASEPDCRDIDVAGLHQGYLRLLRRRGGRLVSDTALPSIVREGGGWRVELAGETFAGGAIVNAAGAWGDEIARQCGVRPLGLTPKRRTALTVDAPTGLDVSAWPVVVDIDERFYFKPEAGHLLLSPADATPSPAVDAQAEEIDVATAIDRVQKVADVPVSRIRHRWAGLRTFAPDGVPVAGWDGDIEGFFWLVGQGGYGIQTAAALAECAAALAMGAEISQDIADQGVDASRLSPSRFRKG